MAFNTVTPTRSASAPRRSSWWSNRITNRGPSPPALPQSAGAEPATRPSPSTSQLPGERSRERPSLTSTDISSSITDVVPPRQSSAEEDVVTRLKHLQETVDKLLTGTHARAQCDEPARPRQSRLPKALTVCNTTVTSKMCLL